VTIYISLYLCQTRFFPDLELTRAGSVLSMQRIGGAREGKIWRPLIFLSPGPVMAGKRRMSTYSRLDLVSKVVRHIELLLEGRRTV